jgi:4-hydroxy-3-polyprenylbenzoate decarboxylase
MEFRATIEALDAAGDLATVSERVDDPNAPFALAAEAARANGPALLLSDVPGTGRLACGVRGGPDRMARRARLPWSRCALGLGLPVDTGYDAMLGALMNPPADRPALRRRDAAATETGCDAVDLCLPSVGESDRPLVSDGIAAVVVDGERLWTPVRGQVRGRAEFRLHVPETFAARADGAPVTLAMGVPTAALAAAHLRCVETQPWRRLSAPQIAAALDDVPVAEAAGGVVPASSEVVVDGRLSRASEAADGPAAAWETVLPSSPMTLRIERLATREDPVVPFSPLGEPLSDDVHLTSLVEAARLQARVDGYWGVSPVEWIGLPVEAELGVCFVASEILYAGFEWQLANTLFSFATSFDKVVVLDTDSTFDDLAKALDDIWVKAHPSHDWIFSEAAAPAATAPRYRTDGETGARLYVNAAWDPRWDDEYIAPEVNFEQVFPTEVRRAVRERWPNLGFGPEADRD